MVTGSSTTVDSSTGLLDIDRLTVVYESKAGRKLAVNSASLSIGSGEIVALVGGSGSGKTTIARSIMQQLPAGGRIADGAINFQGSDLASMSRAALRKVRGRQIGLIPQDPMTSLNPVQRIGDQIAEVLKVHGIGGDTESRVHQALVQAGFQDPGMRARQYPHELSGGLRQRALIAMAIVCDPGFIIADEATSALDVTIQRRILDHIVHLNQERGMGVLLITHDIGIAFERAHRVAVMYQGEIVECEPSQALLTSPQHPYTKRLLESAPSMASTRLIGSRLDGETQARQEVEPGQDVLSVNDVTKEFTLPGNGHRILRAVNHVSLSLKAGESLGIVGESGSGKTTLARLIMGLEKPTEGGVEVHGKELSQANAKSLREIRRDLQMVYQSPFSSLNQLMSVHDIVAEPLRAHGRGTRRERTSRVKELLESVALDSSYMERRPSELSGGQQQRVAIARALALSPSVVVCDEPVSGLDVLVQEQILRLLADLQRQFGMSYIFITHDLAIVPMVCDRVAVMKRGEVVEIGQVGTVFSKPQHDYTKELLSSIPGGI